MLRVVYGSNVDKSLQNIINTSSSNNVWSVEYALQSIT